jgi:hypothetical protein
MYDMSALDQTEAYVDLWVIILILENIYLF